LSGNSIGDEGVKKMEEVLNRHSSLKWFNIGGEKQEMALVLEFTEIKPTT